MTLKAVIFFGNNVLKNFEVIVIRDIFDKKASY